MNEPAPEVFILDAQRQAKVRFHWDNPNFHVTLEDPPQVLMSSEVYAEFARELSDFFIILARRFVEHPPGHPAIRGMRGAWRIASNDDELCIEAWGAVDGFVALSISLASDTLNPAWVVRLNLTVEPTTLPALAAAFAEFARFGLLA